MQSEQVVIAAFHDFLDRAPSAASLSSWTGRLDSGGTSETGFIATLAWSDSAVTTSVNRLYYSILQRIPSPASLAARVHDLESHHRTVASMAAELYSSSEYFAKVGDTNSAWARALYAGVLQNPSPSASQVASWAAAAATHGRLATAVSFYGSAGARTLRVKALYKRELRRASSGAPLAHWTAVDTTSGGDTTVAVGLAASTEYVNVAQSRTILNFSIALPAHYLAGVANDQTISADGTGPYHFEVFGLPAGLTSHDAGNTAHITGTTPYVAGATTIVYSVTDGSGSTETVAAPADVTEDPSLPPLALALNCDTSTNGCLTRPGVPAYGGYAPGAPVTDQLHATGGTGPYSFTATGLPAGLVVSTTGAISGTPTTAAVTSATVTVTDSLHERSTGPILVLVTSPAATQPLSGVTAVVASPNHYECAIAGGHVLCWGNTGAAGHGQAPTAAPTEVPGLTAVTSLANGPEGDMCAVQGGLVYCGIRGGTAFWLNPVQVPGVFHVLYVVASGATACAVTQIGHDMCWGSNANGALGAGLDPAITPSSPTPVEINLNGHITAEAGGFCGYADLVGIECWGANDRGQLGNGSTIASTSPVPVPSTLGTAWISQGTPNVCVLNGGQVSCWGANDAHQTGSAAAGDVTTPHLVPIPSLFSVTKLAVTSAGACAIAGGGTSGTLYCWGTTATSTTTSTTSATPTPIGLTSPTDVLMGSTETCAITYPGNVWCWGGDHNGNGTASFSSTPVQAAGLSNIVSLWGTDDAVCATDTLEAVSCWGINDHGNAGVASGRTPSPVLTPTTLAGVTGVASADTSTSTSCVVSWSGQLRCWGDDDEGQVDGIGGAGPITSPLQL